MPSPGSFPAEGGCDCRHIRYRLERAPLFVHCCHCRWCQRESGSSFALNALIEADRVTALGHAPELIDTPSASGSGQLVARCPKCKVAVWSNYAGAGPWVRFVRVGTLDNPDLLPPDIHIFTASRQPWVVLPAGVPAVAGYYDRNVCWPAESLARRAALLLRIDANEASTVRQRARSGFNPSPTESSPVMHQPTCLFCRIASGEIPARIVHETKDVFAFLDIRPIRQGHVLVVPRAHYPYFDDMPADVTQQVMSVAQRLAPVLRSSFGAERVGLLFTGVDVAHAHAHVVPMVEPTDLTSPRYIEEQNLHFRPAPMADGGQLDSTAHLIRRSLDAGAGAAT